MHLTRWIETHANLRPEKTAVVDRVSGITLTYRDLHRASLAQAARLESQGVRSGDRVAVFSANRPEILELLFACSHLGAVLVPLNWRLSRPELEAILRDCQPEVLFVDPDMADRAPEHHKTLNILGLRSSPAMARAFTPQQHGPETPVAIFYTGGTTGTPKGAVLTHRSIQANAWNTIAGWGLSPDDVAPIFTPMFHTGGFNVFATPLLCLGGTVVLPGPFDPEDALEVIAEERCTVVFMVPTMYDMLRKVEGFGHEAFKGVKLMISGGAPCPRSLFEAYWKEGLPLKQGYGLTEAGPNTFGVRYEDARTRVGTVGFPLPGVRLRLVTEDGREAGPDEVGELQVTGDHLMSGYLGRPAVFIDGWLPTGDLAYRDKDGFYFICGRSKDMFISGGENVFPAEIEEVILEHPGVLEAAVVGVPHPKWGEVGRAYVVGNTEGLAEFCRSRLAGYKVPKEIVEMDSLPKSAAGKVLKNLLAEKEAVVR